MNLRQLTKNFSFTIFSNLITLGVSTLLVLVVPKFIGVQQYGYWQLYMFYATYAGVMTFGWADGIYLRYGGRRYEDLDKDLFHSQFVMYFLFQLLVFFVIVLYGNFCIQGEKQFILYMVAICLVLFNARGFILYVLQDTNRIKEYAIVNAAGRVLYFISVVISLFLNQKNYKLLIISDLIGRAFSLVIGSIYIKDIIFRKFTGFYWSFRETWLNLTVGVKLLTANFAGMLIIGVVRYGIQAFWGVSTFGKVSLTLSISNFLMTFISAISLVLYPVLRRLSNEKIRLMYPEIRDILMVILLVGLFLYYPIDYILPMWLPKYKDSLVYMAILFPMCVYQGKFDLLINTFMKTFRLEKALLNINIIAMLFSMAVTAVNVFLIHNLTVLMFSIILILWVQTSLGELYLTKKLHIDIWQDLFLETVVVIIFMMSSWLLSRYLGLLVYAVSLGAYLYFKRTVIIKGFKLITNNIKQ